MNTEQKFYLVTFYGAPDWKGENTKIPCTRRYLFSSMEKAEAFVRRRTNTDEWITPRTFPVGSMALRLKKGCTSRYNIVALTVDDVYDEDLSEIHTK